VRQDETRREKDMELTPLEGKTGTGRDKTRERHGTLFLRQGKVGTGRDKTRTRE